MSHIGENRTTVYNHESFFSSVFSTVLNIRPFKFQLFAGPFNEEITNPLPTNMICQNKYQIKNFDKSGK